MCLRMMKHFMINNPDFLYKMHYAPRDSKSHSVERVLASLNEAVGNGRFISPKLQTLRRVLWEDFISNELCSDLRSHGTVLKRLHLGMSVQAVWEQVSMPMLMILAVFTMVSGMMNLICLHDIIILQKKKKKSMPGSSYCQFLQNQFSEHFIRY